MAATREIETFAEIRKRLGWRLHAGIWCFGIGGAIVTMYVCPAYFWPIVAAAGAIGLILLRFWNFSTRAWFWMAMVPLAILQIPLIVISRDVGAKWSWLFGFFFMLADILMMDTVIKWVSPELKRSR
jgi:hypothetical protein